MMNNRLNAIDILKAQIDTHRPLTPHLAGSLRDYFRVATTYTSNALEGNSLTETETKVVLEDGLTIGGKSLREHFEVVGHAQAFDHMLALAGQKIIAEQDILRLHHLFYFRIDEQRAGSYRTERVFVSGTDYAFPTPEQVPSLMQGFAEDIPNLYAQYHPVEAAARLHLEFVLIHPFIDGNGRTARLLMNLTLLQHGYAIAIVPPLMRSTYLQTLKESNRGNKQPFIDFIVEMVYESHKDYVRLLTPQH